MLHVTPCGVAASGTYEVEGSYSRRSCEVAAVGGLFHLEFGVGPSSLTDTGLEPPPRPRSAMTVCNVDQNPRACLRLRAACEKLKKVLSANPEAPLNIECLMDEKDVRGFIKREEFEQISSPILERVKVPLEKALAEAGLTVEDIHSIEVVGSGSRIPAIIGILRGFFGLEPRRTMNASECVARGCALQCAALSPAFRVRDFQVHESFPFPITLSWEGSVLESQDGVEDIRHSAVVFPKGDPIPSTKFLTFYSCNSFSVDVMCTDLNGFNGPQIISNYLIGPFQATKNEGAKFKVKVCLTIHGTVSVESATMLEEEIEVPVSEGHHLKNYTMSDIDDPVNYSGSQNSVDMHDAKYPTDGSSSGIENGPVPENMPVQLGAAQSGSKIKAPEKKLKGINVPFTELVFGGMTPEEVCKATEVELVMACQDRLMEETKDKKNALEAYVYDMRNKLHSKYHEFIAAEEMQLFCKKLQEVEDWLYEEGEDEIKEVYVAVLEELIKLGNPVEERYKNWADKDPAIQEFFDVVERFRKMAYCKIRRYDHIDKEERQKIVDVCENGEKWLSEKIELQSSLPKYATPVLLAADVRREAEDVYRFCHSIMSKRKPPPVNQQIPPPTEKQHPQPEDTAQQPPGGDGAGDAQPDASDVEPEAASDPMDTESTAAGGATDATLRQA